MSTTDNAGRSGQQTQRNPEGELTETSGLPIDVDAGTTDLGEDAYRTATNRSNSVGGASNEGLEGGVDPGLTDLGDDVRR
jgi:hypothetical protein